METAGAGSELGSSSSIGLKRTYAEAVPGDDSGKTSRRRAVLRDPRAELHARDRPGASRHPGLRCAGATKRFRVRRVDVDADDPLAVKLRRRAEGGVPGCDEGFRRRCLRERFDGMQLRQEFDAHDPDSVDARPPFLRRRSRVTEITAAQDLVFALTHTGRCAVFSTVEGRRLGFLNHGPDVVVRSLFLNRANESIVTVSVEASDQYRSLKCRSISWSSIRRRKAEDYGFFIFESEDLRFPGFVEFDDVNGKVLTHSASDAFFKFWDLATYRHLYTISRDRIAEIKISPGIILVVRERMDSHVPLEVRNIETGEVIKAWNQMLRRGRKVDFIEAFQDKLLVKQENEKMQIIDVRSLVNGPRSDGAGIVEVCRSQFLIPSSFVFLYERQLFLTFRNQEILVWDYSGQLVTRLEDHQLFHEDPGASNLVYVTSKQDLIISLCRQSECEHGTINVTNILTGKRVAKLNCVAGDEGRRSRALAAVSALYYNEERNEIYTGSRQGEIHVWRA